MIVYYKLDALLAERKITKTKLYQDTGISTNIIAKISRNECFKTDTLNRICEYLQVQPSDIMEWVPDEKYNDKEFVEIEKKEINKIKKIRLEAQIAELQAKLKEIN